MRRSDDLDAFCAREYPRLVGALDLYLGDVHVAEEIAQEALVRTSQRWARVRRLDSPGGWTHRVAINLANSWFRRRRAEARAYARVRVEAVHEDADIAGREALRDAVAALPQPQRAALVLRYYVGLSAPEVADHLATTPDAIRARTKRAVAALRAQFGPDAIATEEAHDVA